MKGIMIPPSRTIQSASPLLRWPDARRGSESSPNELSRFLAVRRSMLGNCLSLRPTSPRNTIHSRQHAKPLRRKPYRTSLAEMTAITVVTVDARPPHCELVKESGRPGSAVNPERVATGSSPPWRIPCFGMRIRPGLPDGESPAIRGETMTIGRAVTVSGPASITLAARDQPKEHRKPEFMAGASSKSAS